MFLLKKEVPIDKRLVILSLPVLGLVLVGLIASGFVDAFPPLARFLIVFAVFSYLPGEPLLRLLMPRAAGAPELRLPLAIVAGVSMFAVLSWICWISGMSFRAYMIVLQAAAAASFAATLVFRRDARSRRGTAVEGGFGRAHARKSTAFLAVAVAVAAYFVAYPPSINPQSDSPDHLGYIRNIIVQDRMAPDDVVAPAVFAGEKPLREDPRKGALHPFLAAVSVLSSNEPVEVWRMLPVVLAPVAVLAFASFASALLPTASMQAGALLLFLMFQGGLGRHFLGVVAYGQHVSMVFFWLLVVLALRGAPTPSRGPLVVIGLLGLGGALIHIDVALQATLIYVGFLVFHGKLGFSRAGILRLGIALAGGVVVGTAWRFSMTAPVANLMHAHPQGLLYFGGIGSPLYTVSPIEVIRKDGLVFFAGLFLVALLPLVCRSSRYGPSAWIGLALALPPIAVAFNPLIAPLVYERGTYLLHRFVLNVPSFSITVLVLGSTTVWARRGSLWKKGIAAILLLAWAQPFLTSAKAWWADARTAHAERHGIASAGDIRDELSEIIPLFGGLIPPNSVVLSDPLTSYVLSAFADVRVVAVLHQHANPNDPYPIARLDAVHAVLSPYTGQDRMVYALQKFGVDYVVVNGAFRAPYHDYMANWDPAFKTVLEQKLGSLTPVFKTVYDEGGIVIYRVLGTSFESTTWTPDIPFTGPLELEYGACEGEAVKSARLVSVGVKPSTPFPGERIALAGAYRRGAGEYSGLPLVLRIRVQDREYFEKGPHYPGDKYVRRFLERWKGVPRRFRIDRTPFLGYFLPQEWPEESTVYDAFEYRLPAGLAETRYDVQAELVEETLLPNFTVRDLLFNNDSFRGSSCAGIDVRRRPDG